VGAVGEGEGGGSQGTGGTTAVVQDSSALGDPFTPGMLMQGHPLQQPWMPTDSLILHDFMQPAASSCSQCTREQTDDVRVNPTPQLLHNLLWQMKPVSLLHMSVHSVLRMQLAAAPHSDLASRMRPMMLCMVVPSADAHSSTVDWLVCSC